MRWKKAREEHPKYYKEIRYAVNQQRYYGLGFPTSISLIQNVARYDSNYRKDDEHGEEVSEYRHNLTIPFWQLIKLIHFVDVDF